MKITENIGCSSDSQRKQNHSVDGGLAFDTALEMKNIYSKRISIKH